MEVLNTTAAPNLTAELMAAILVATILICCCHEPKWKNPYTLPCFIAWTALVLMILLADMVYWTTVGHEDMEKIRRISDAVKHCAGSCIYTMSDAFFFSLMEDKRKTPKWLRLSFLGVPIILGVLVGLSVYFGMVFGYDARGLFCPGPQYRVFLIITRLLALSNCVIVLWYHKAVGWHDALVMVSFSILPTALGHQETWHMTPCYLSLALVQLFIYLAVCRRRLERTQRQQKELMEMDLQLMESRVNTMVSQIQPHFIFNALTTIRYLCGDAEEARQAIADFSDYLRVNIQSLKTTEPIPFRQELEHIRTYLHFEQLRFGEKLLVKYEIGPENFSLPSLSVQPIVENAVKYGLAKKPAGGTVGLRTAETEKCWLVQIWDDGVGFDPDAITGENHVGLENVRNRLDIMCSGSLKIESKLGSGTLVTLYIPKEPGRTDHAANGSR